MKAHQRILFTMFCLSLLSGCGASPEVQPIAKSDNNGDRQQQDAGSQAADDRGAMTLSQPASEKSPASEPSPAPKFSDEAFLRAAHDGNMQIIKLAIQSGTEVMATDPQGHNALHMAAYNGHTSVVKFFLQQGIEIDSRDGEGKSALFHASSGPFNETVQLLIDNGADVNLTEKTEGFTPLMVAAAEGQLDVVLTLLQHGADKTAIDIDGDTAEKFASDKGHSEVVKALRDES